MQIYLAAVIFLHHCKIKSGSSLGMRLVFYITYLEYPTYNKEVWLYDANIDYLSGKHIPLFIGAVLVFLSLFFLTLSCFPLVSGCRSYHIWSSSHGPTV